jgi:hypothetical protein
MAHYNGSGQMKARPGIFWFRTESMTDDDHVKLLYGPYTPPALRVGDRAMCLYRDAEVVIYDWSIAGISWPLCYHAGTRGAGKGLLVDEELARAIRLESAVAVGHWWRVCGATVLKWRRVLGVGRRNNPGTQRLIRAAVTKASASREIMKRRGSPVGAVCE